MDMNSFETGPVVNEVIVAWLNGNAGKRLLQLPVEIHASALGIESSYLGVGPKKIELRLDTNALSIDLPMHLLPFCPAYPCRVWLQGTWGPLIPDQSEKGLPVFAVKKVVDIAGPDATHVRMAK